MRLAAAFTERVLPRASSALTLLLLAWLATPELVGTLGWATLALTALRAVTDQAARQVVLEALQGAGGQSFLRHYRLLVGTVGPVVLVLACWFAASTAADQTRVFLSLLPMALIPAAFAVSLEHVGNLQLQGKWNLLAKIQLVASVFALGPGLGLLWWRRDLLGIAVQAALSELIFAALLAVGGRSCRAASRGAPGSLRTKFVMMSGYSALGWLQAQSDRALVGLAAGTPTLGQYSLGLSLARSAGDALAAASATMLRARLAITSEHNDPAECRAASHSLLMRALAGASGLSLAVIVTVHWVVAPLLSEDWDDAIAMVPVMTLCTLPAVLAWSNAVLQLKANSGVTGTLGPAIGLVMSVPIAASATWSLTAAAWFALLREFMVVVVGFRTAGPFAPWRSLVACTAWTVLLAGIVTLI